MLKLRKGDFKHMNGISISKHAKTNIGLLSAHIHKFHELYYLMRGSMRYIIGSKIYEVSQADVVLVPKGALHNTSYDECDTERMLITFGDEFVADEALLSCFERGVIHLSEKRCFEFEALYAKLAREIERDDEYSALLAKQYVSEILVMLMRRDSSKAVGVMDGYPAIMQEAMRYISDNLASKISLTEIAHRFSLSKSFFSRKFKEITGFGFSEYLTHVRIKRAEELLLTSDMSMTDVAYAAGFEDSSYFAATFKRIIGTTPLKYANEKHNKE